MGKEQNLAIVCIVEYSCGTNSKFTMIRSDQFYHHHVQKENLEKKLGKEYRNCTLTTIPK